MTSPADPPEYDPGRDAQLPPDPILGDALDRLAARYGPAQAPDWFTNTEVQPHGRS